MISKDWKSPPKLPKNGKNENSWDVTFHIKCCCGHFSIFQLFRPLLASRISEFGQKSPKLPNLTFDRPKMAENPKFLYIFVLLIFGDVFRPFFYTTKPFLSIFDQWNKMIFRPISGHFSPFLPKKWLKWPKITRKYQKSALSTLCVFPSAYS